MSSFVYYGQTQSDTKRIYFFNQQTMQTLDIKAAAKLFKVARSTIYTRLEKGELSRSEDGKINFVELVRVLGEPGKRETRQEKTERVSELFQTLHTTDTDAIRHEEREAELKKELAEIKLKLAEKDELLNEAREREKWLQNQFGKLTETIKLLEAPKPQEEKKQGFWKKIFG